MIFSGLHRRSGGERGTSLLELLVALALMSAVLVIASYIEMSLLRRVRKAESELPSLSSLVATRQIKRDVLEATELIPRDVLKNVEGARLLLLKRSRIEPDQFTLYRMEGQVLLRSQYLDDGTVLSEDRVLARDLVRCSLEPDKTGRAVQISLASVRGAPTSTYVALRTHPSVLPPPPKQEKKK